MTRRDLGTLAPSFLDTPRLGLLLVLLHLGHLLSNACLILSVLLCLLGGGSSSGLLSSGSLFGGLLPPCRHCRYRTVRVSTAAASAWRRAVVPHPIVLAISLSLPLKSTMIAAIGAFAFAFTVPTIISIPLPSVVESIMFVAPPVTVAVVVITPPVIITISPVIMATATIVIVTPAVIVARHLRHNLQPSTGQKCEPADEGRALLLARSPTPPVFPRGSRNSEGSKK